MSHVRICLLIFFHIDPNRYQSHLQIAPRQAGSILVSGNTHVPLYIVGGGKLVAGYETTKDQNPIDARKTETVQRTTHAYIYC